MDLSEKLKLLQEDIDNQIKIFSLKRARTKSKAFKLKIYSILAAASITVLLGINLQSELWANIFKNISLILGAIITVLNAIDSFYDYRALWIQYTITLVRLYDLKREIEFYTVGEETSKLELQQLTKYLARLDDILKDDLKSWLRIRGRTLSTEDKKSKARI